MAPDLMQLIPNLTLAYRNLIPNIVFYGVIIGILCVGMWRRNRSVRLVLVTFTICGSFLFYVGSGLELGIPANIMLIGKVLTALAFAGIVLTFIKR